ncbi:WD40 repeat domain-containing serine/threonine protein kinase [Dictyobacter arantiisoli]|uniref:non-specific serine/threonine protein kinase n=1 Tax=Dictyobacter arantiisoli TaxID=2014874 RepID=A0A5A5TC95_9CHLR|nr:WD40 repeat domain-containing serine/threonine protein kinase [Dictyobacter arantiisoli]GCF09130.1 hypothetical protein KDI_26940 [Dictyobacter arantiisoli]
MGLERYLFKKKLPSGHMSEVWLAVDRERNKEVVVKLMKVHEGEHEDVIWRNQKTEERFEREITILRTLRHVQILPLLDSGYSAYNGHVIPYLVSPYIPEGSLASLMSLRPPWRYWSLRQVGDAIMQAAACLQYLHNSDPQIIHEDIKPGNFLYRSVNTPERAVYLYLFDFGISRFKHQTFAMTSEVVGTFAFMAPEQIAQQVDAATDQYALAIMACLLLTGEFPIYVPDQQHLEAHRYEQPRPPSLLAPQRFQSERIDQIILQALEKRPEKRFPSVLEFARAFQQAIDAYGEEQTEPVRLAITPTPRFLLPRDSTDIDERHILDEPLPIRPARAISLDAQHQGEALVLHPLLLQGPERISLPMRLKTVCWSPAGSALLCILYGSLSVYLPVSGQLQPVTTVNAGRVSTACWSPDNRIVAVAGDHKIYFWDIERGLTLPLTLQLSISTLQGMDWSVRDQLAIWVEDTVRIYQLSEARLQQSRPATPQTISTGTLRCDNLGTLRWSPDGLSLAAGSSHGEVICWSVGGKQSPWQVASTGQKVQSLIWSPDGSLLIVATKDKRVSGWHTHTHASIFNWARLPALPRMLSISPRERITIASNDKQLVLGFPQDSTPTATLPGQLIAAWSPTENRLATLDERNANTLIIWTEESDKTV